jgi:hypothetical protein
MIMEQQTSRCLQAAGALLQWLCHPTAHLLRWPAMTDAYV